MAERLLFNNMGGNIFTADKYMTDRLVRMWFGTVTTDFRNQVIYLTAINKKTGSKNTHIFDNENGEMFDDDHIYFAKIEDISGSLLYVSETRLLAAGEELPNTIVNGINSSKGKEETISKKNIMPYINDTGWIKFYETTIGIDTFTFQSRKIGKEVYIKGNLIPTITLPTASTVATLKIGTLAQDFRPEQRLRKFITFSEEGADSLLGYTRISIEIVIEKSGSVTIYYTLDKKCNRTGTSKTFADSVIFSYLID